MKCAIRMIVVLVFATMSSAGETDAPAPFHPANTFSIVCYDSVTRQFGAAVQSHWFKTADVIWAEPGSRRRKRSTVS